MELIHHGGHEGVTGSCHQLRFDSGKSLLVDCGLFQGRDARRRKDLEIEFPLDGIEALLLTHVHIDHVGRLPYLFAAGFRGPIYTSKPSARLLPLVLEDALKVGFTRNERMIRAFLERLDDLLHPVGYGQWEDVAGICRTRFHTAGHILGSAWIDVEADGQRAVFSGDLGAPDSPLLKDPQSPEHADILVLESTYGDRLHDDRTTRRDALEALLRKTLRNKGVTIIPAFSLGRTQTLLYEMNGIFERVQQDTGHSLMKAIDVIVDSPLASRFTEIYKEMQPYWDEEAHEVLKYDSQPLVFENLFTVGSHDEHRDTLKYLDKSGIPAIVIAASGMCTGGRVVNYLKKLLDEPNTDILFVGYQATGTPGRDIQRGGRRVELDRRSYSVRAAVHTLTGYSAHADQQNLLDFVGGMQSPPGRIVLVHGEEDAKQALREKLEALGHRVT